MRFRIVISFLFSVLLLSCSSVPEDPGPVGVIDRNLLVNSRGWVVASSEKDDGNATEDLFMHYAACMADNIYRFESNGRYVIDEADAKCRETDSQTKESGTWLLNGNTLMLSPEGAVPYQFTVGSLSAEKLVFTYIEVGANGVVKSITTITLRPVTEI